MENWIQVISLLLNLLLGSGLIVTLVTLKAQKQRALADAELAIANANNREIENVDKAIAIWRTIAENMSLRNNEIAKQNEELVKQNEELVRQRFGTNAKLEKLEKQITRLNNINNRIVKLLDQITPDNLEKKVEEIKQQISNNV